MENPGPPKFREVGIYFWNWIYLFWEWVTDNIVKDFYFEVASGRLNGYSSVNKFGVNTSVADGTEEKVWSPSHAYTYSTTDDITHVVSSSASDNGKDVEIQGLDVNWNLVTQTVTLGTPATTGVVLNTDLLRVFRMKLNDTPSNVGVVQVGVGAVTSAFTAGNLRAQIDALAGQTLMAIYAVPAKKTAYMIKYYGSIIGEAGPPATVPDHTLFKIYAIDNHNGYAAQIKHETGTAIAGSSLIEHEFGVPVKFTQKSDIYLTALADGDDAYVSAGFDIILEDNQT